MQNCLLEVPSISVHKCPCADTQGACVESVHTRSYEEGRHPVPGGAGPWRSSICSNWQNCADARKV